MLAQIFHFENKNRKFVQKELMIRAIIAVDRIQTLEKVAGMVTSCCPNVEVVAKVESVKTGVEGIVLLTAEIEDETVVVTSC